MGTRVDFDEALANKEETKRRVAAGEQLDVYMDGVPFTYFRRPEDVDGFEPRRKNPEGELRARREPVSARVVRDRPRELTDDERLRILDLDALDELDLPEALPYDEIVGAIEDGRL